MSLLASARKHLDALSQANDAFAAHYPGEPATRQPVHTVYGGAHLFKAKTPRRLGELALESFKAHAKDPVEFALGVGFIAASELRDVDPQALEQAYRSDPGALRQSHPAWWLAARVHDRVQQKLEREPVEDFRIDFEDGFGARSDDEEDAAAKSAAAEVARAMDEATLPPFLGIRIKTLSQEWKLRAARTLEVFLDSLLPATRGKLPDNFVVTLPKVTHAAQPSTLVRLLELCEHRYGLLPGALKLELMIETTQALLGPDGRSPLPDFLKACEGRCVGAHLGTYDFTASCNITAAHQTMLHPMCDLAKGMMLLAYASTGIFLSDGATNVMPVAPHRGPHLTPDELERNRSVVHAAWKVAHRHNTHSLEGGYYQGWDLHPAQLPVRYASCYAFFLAGFAVAAERLRNFVDKAAQATLVGDVFDDAATGQGLLNYFIRAQNCGAVDASEIAQTGLTQDEFGLRSFAKILAARKARLGG
ncbi:MAG TPA: phosphoenolpyruvate kinase [Polyangiaceae bacterium]|nr:phosphoenolpyruvate kinase [Polyangiaceae bacterium]